MQDLFAEFDRAPMSYEEMLQERDAKGYKPCDFPNHWEMFDPPEVKRIRPEGA